MSALGAVVINGFRESRRNRVTVVVFLFALVMIFSATFALELTVATFERVFTDLGLGVMSLISVFLAIFLASGLIPKDIERRTIFMVVSKPISRSTFIVGRLLGNIVTVWFVTLMMTALFGLQMAQQGAPFHQAHIAAIVGLLFEVTLLSSLSFLFASTSSQLVAAVISTGFYFVGHLSTDLYKTANRSASTAIQVIGKALYYVLPNLDRLDFKGRATYAEATPWSELLSSGVYALGYSVVLVVVACVLFERRDFR